MTREEPFKKNLLPKCLLLCFLFLLFTLRLPANESGRFSVTLQNQSFKIHSPENDYFSSLNSVYLHLWQSLGKGSSFHFSLNYYFDQGVSQLASYNVGLQQIPLGKFKMAVDFGTISYPLSSLSFFGSFNPNSYRGLKGGKITLTSYKTDIILFGGELYSGYDMGPHSEKSRIYGARTIFRPGRRWTFGTGWMKITDMPTGSFSLNRTADYHVFSVDSSVMAVKNLYILGDLRFIFDQSRDNKNGFFIKTGTYYNNGNLSFEISYSYLSPHYPDLRTIFIQDHRGITIMGQYRPFSWLSVYSGFDTFNEQMRDITGVPPAGDFLTYRVGSTFSLKKLPQISFNYNRSMKEVPGAGPDSGTGSHRDTDFDFYFVSLSKQTHRFFWSLYYNKGKFMRPRSIAGNYDLKRIFLNLRWSYPTGHYIYFTGSLDQRQGIGTTPAKNFNIQLGANIRMASYLQLNIQGDYAAAQYMTEGANSRRYAIGGGVIYRFKPLKINCSLRYQYAQTEDPLTQNPPRYSHQVFFSINRDFYWGMKTSPALKGADTGAKGSGKIKGSVFVDLNQNELQEQGEQGLPDISILLDNYPVTRTDKNGRFSISPVYAGPHKISLDLRNIPAIYEAGREKTDIMIKKKETTVVHLTVVPVGLISGQVILDKNENNKIDKDEPFLKDIRVNLWKDGKLLRWEFTNVRGVFTFDNLRPGTYTVKVDEENVFEKYNGLEKSILQATINPWEEKKGLVILLNEYKKDRIKKILDY